MPARDSRSSIGLLDGVISVKTPNRHPKWSEELVGFIDSLGLMLAMPDAASSETRCHAYSVLTLLEQSRRLDTPARLKD